MGAFSSKPKKSKKPKGRGKRPTNLRDSVALRQRISLNKETLNRILTQIGHPVPEKSRASILSPQMERALRTLTTHAFAMALQGGETSNTEHRVLGLHHQVDKDKPLPPWPSVATITKLDEEQVPLWPPLVTARRLEEQLERNHIQRQREDTLRLLEVGPEPHQPPGSRVPTIIQRRIRRAGVAWDGSSFRPRDNRG